MVAHLPPRRVQLVRRYGVYAGKVRKQWQERPSIYRLAPDGWQKGHPNKSSIAQTTPQESEQTVQVPDAWSKLRRQSWARLLQKVYEVDPFVCKTECMWNRITPRNRCIFGSVVRAGETVVVRGKSRISTQNCKNREITVPISSYQFS